MIKSLKNTVKRIASRCGFLIRKRHFSEELSASVHRVSHRAIDGRFLVLNPADAVQGHHARGEFYEEPVLDLILENFENGVFVDVGANVGNHSIYVAKARPSSNIISFEPHPEAFAILSANVALNRLNDRITMNQVALSNCTERARIGTPHHNLGGSTLEVEVRGRSEPQSFETVQTVTGAEALSVTVSFIKIDVEGHELKCLEGLSEVLRVSRPKVLVEVDSTTALEVAEFLEKLGYQEVDRDIGTEFAQTVLYDVKT
jgi:FkbM family methyltransferase